MTGRLRLDPWSLHTSRDDLTSDFYVVRVDHRASDDQRHDGDGFRVLVHCISVNVSVNIHLLCDNNSVTLGVRGNMRVVEKGVVVVAVDAVEKRKTHESVCIPK